MSDPPALGAAAPTTSDVPEPEQSTMSAATYPSLATDGNGRVVSAVGGLSPPVLAPPVGFMPPMGFPEARRPAPKPAAKPDQRHGRWTEEERRPASDSPRTRPLPPIPRHAEFLELMQRYGRSWTKISSVMKTRTEPQVRSHAQKHFLRINKEEGVDPAAKRPRTNAGGHLAPNELPRHLAAGSPDAAHVAAFGGARPGRARRPTASGPGLRRRLPAGGLRAPGPYGAHPGAYVGAPPSAPRPPYYGAPPPDAAAAAQAQAAQALYSLPQAAPPPAGYAPPPAGYAPPPAGYAPPPPPPPPQAPPGQAAPAGVALGLLQQLEQLPPDQKHALLQAAMTNVTTPTPAAPQEPAAPRQGHGAAIARERAATSAAPAPAKDGAPTPRSRRSSPKRTSPSSSAAPRPPRTP
ncbi:hypothetical protein JL722_1764 [Aureococcus anophagefferens]|nr:hypothetical protein JL722_1764 [Aureococcus anophagefferens]